MNSNSNLSIERCSCDETEISQESDTSSNDSPQTKDKKTKLSLASLGLNLRRGRSLHFTKRTKKTQDPITPETSSGSSSTSSSSVAVLNSAIRKLPKWGLKFNCAKKVSKSLLNAANEHCCKCTCYKKKDEVGCSVLPTASEEAVSSKEEVVEAVGVEDEEVEVEEAAAVAVVEDVEKNEEAAEVKAADGEEQEEGNVGIYGTNFLSFPPAILNGQFLDVHW